MVGDPCLLLKPRSHPKSNPNLVGLNLSSLEAIWGNSPNRVVAEGIKICKALQKKGYSVILIPFRTDDLSALVEISRATKTQIFNGGNDVTATMDFIASCRVLIGEILPSAIFSAAAHTPFVMIAYQPKCLDFVNTVGFGKYTIRTNEMTCEKVIALTENLLDNWNNLQAQLVRTVEIYRKKLRNIEPRIMEDIESRSPDRNWSIPSTAKGVKWFTYQHLDRFLYRRARRIWQTTHKIDARISAF